MRPSLSIIRQLGRAPTVVSGLNMPRTITSSLSILATSSSILRFAHGFNWNLSSTTTTTTTTTSGVRHFSSSSPSSFINNKNNINKNLGSMAGPLGPFAKMSQWGWIVYRTAYGPGTDELWAQYQSDLQQHVGTFLSKAEAAMNDNPAAAGAAGRAAQNNDDGGEGLPQWMFVSDEAALDGADLETLRELFGKKLKDEGLFPPNYMWFAVADESCLKDEKKKVVLVKAKKDVRVDADFGSDGAKELSWDELGKRSIVIKMGVAMMGKMFGMKMPGMR